MYANAEGIDFEGRHYTLYEATQRQRRLETFVRKTKRKILIDEATGDAEKLQWDQIRLVRQREEYHRFSKAAGLPEQYERMEKAGFTWKHDKAAEKVAVTQEGLDLAEGLGYTTSSDKKQFELYRKVLKDKVPASLAEFRQMKRENASMWDTLKKQYRVVNQYKVDSGEFTVDEILDLDNQLISEKRDNFSSKFKRSGNIAGAYVDKEYYLAHSNIATIEDAKAYKGSSKLVTLRTNRAFQYIDVKKENGSIRTGTFHDTEAKLFEEFAAMYAEKPFSTITLISERGMCDSCKGVMEQFMARFPDVEVRAISHKKVEGDVWKYRRRKK